MHDFGILMKFLDLNGTNLGTASISYTNLMIGALKSENISNFFNSNHSCLLHCLYGVHPSSNVFENPRFCYSKFCLKLEYYKSTQVAKADWSYKWL